MGTNPSVPKRARCWYCFVGRLLIWAAIVAAVLWLILPNMGGIDLAVRLGLIVAAVAVITVLEEGRVKIPLPLPSA